MTVTSGNWTNGSLGTWHWFPIVSATRCPWTPLLFPPDPSSPAGGHWSHSGAKDARDWLQSFLAAACPESGGSHRNLWPGNPNWTLDSLGTNEVWRVRLEDSPGYKVPALPASPLRNRAGTFHLYLFVASPFSPHPLSNIQVPLFPH